MTIHRRQVLAGAALGLTGAAWWPTAALASADRHDHQYDALTVLLKRHVKLGNGGQSSSVNYGALATERTSLQTVLRSLSAATPAQFTAWSKPQQQAFLINAYNAFTLELILSRFPNLKSIKDLGSFIQSPWKPKWIDLLGGKVSLDDIEHEMLRARGRYDDPRVHFAVNCASIGCPGLREESFTAERLETQLDEQARRFMSDRSRNRYNAQRGRLELSKIFDWFREDFTLGHQGISSLAAFAARYADLLADAPADREKIRAQKVDIAFLDYDWNLNKA